MNRFVMLSRDGAGDGAGGGEGLEEDLIGRVKQVKFGDMIFNLLNVSSCELSTNLVI